MRWWWPRLQASGVDVPRTEIVECEEGSLLDFLDGKPPADMGWFFDALALAGDKVGWPAFLRTGHGSGKHDWERTCFVPSGVDLVEHVGAIVYWSHCVDFFGLDTDYWAIRELMPTAAAFLAPGFSNMPVTRERRWFFANGQPVGHHPYWPPHAVADADPTEPNWRDLLDDLNEQTDAEIDHLHHLTSVVAEQFDGEAMSLDWLHVPDRGWVAIDMALASTSFVWEDHPTAPNAEVLR